MKTTIQNQLRYYFVHKEATAMSVEQTHDGDLAGVTHYFFLYLETPESFEIVSLFKGPGSFAVDLIEKQRMTLRGTDQKWGLSFSPAFRRIRDLEMFLKRNCHSEEEYLAELRDLRSSPDYPKE